MKKMAFVKYSDAFGNQTQTGPYELGKAEATAEMMNAKSNVNGFYWCEIIEKQKPWMQGVVDIDLDVELKVLKHIYGCDLSKAYYERIDEYLHAAKLGTDILIQNMMSWSIKDDPDFN